MLSLEIHPGGTDPRAQRATYLHQAHQEGLDKHKGRLLGPYAPERYPRDATVRNTSVGAGEFVLP